MTGAIATRAQNGTWSHRPWLPPPNLPVRFPTPRLERSPVAAARDRPRGRGRWSSSASASTPRERFGTLRDEQAALVGAQSARHAADRPDPAEPVERRRRAPRHARAAPSPTRSSAWANTFAPAAQRSGAGARARARAGAGRPPDRRAGPARRGQPPLLGRHGSRLRGRRPERGIARGRAAGAAIIRGEASARHAELVTLVSQLVIHNTRVDEASAARGRDVYDRVARQIYLLAAVLVAGVVIGGAVLLSRHAADVRDGAEPGRRAAGALVAHADDAGDAADRVRPRAARRVRPDPDRHRDDAGTGQAQGERRPPSRRWRRSSPTSRRRSR